MTNLVAVLGTAVVAAFLVGAALGVLWERARTEKKSEDLYGDLALKLGTSREAIQKAVFGKLYGRAGTDAVRSYFTRGKAGA